MFTILPDDFFIIANILQLAGNHYLTTLNSQQVQYLLSRGISEIHSNTNVEKYQKYLLRKMRFTEREI